MEKRKWNWQIGHSIVLIVTSVRMAPPLPLIVLLMIHGVYSQKKAVSYSPSHICALKDSTVIMNCTYPTGDQIMNVFWTNTTVKDNGEYPDLSKDPEYSQRLQYLGDNQQNCTVRLSHVTLKDSHKYYFRFITDKDDGKWLGKPGVTLTVTDLQAESPGRVTEGESVRLTCKSSCTLTDRAEFIWSRNSQPLTERRDGNNELLLQSVRREDAGRYSCAVHGHTHTSPGVHLNVTYPPKSVSVLMSGSGVIVEGDSVTLSCSSDSNPPALNFSWFKENEASAVGSGQSFSALQSGRFYCQAHNQHGSQRSDAVTVTVIGSSTIASRGAGCAQDELKKPPHTHATSQQKQRVADYGPIERAIVLSHLSQLGLCINWEKAKLSPVQRISFSHSSLTHSSEEGPSNSETGDPMAPMPRPLETPCLALDGTWRF
ncbi:B-cell receptor CD22-like [Pseudorasbora parva]|uniref:B-cell receptor CD22-like n=1 Tax=Pseudorasbora parva TaxID=51549 RepID=UPI00351DE897